HLDGIYHQQQVPQLAQGGAQPRWDGKLHAGRRAPGGEIPAKGIQPGRHGSLLSRRSGPIYWTPNARRRHLNPQPARGHVCRGGLHFHVRVLEGAHQFPLCQADVREDQGHPFRQNFKVIVGGSGGWQITQTDSFEALGVDCVVEGRSESMDAVSLFHKAIRGETLPREVNVAHPTDREGILVPEKRTTFGVVEMTTGCGRRCQFCVPDLNPQIDVPKDKIMAAVRANVREGNSQISLATEDMFIWGQVHTGTPFFFPNREALVSLYTDIVETPGVKSHLLSHSTMAPFVVDPLLIKKLSEKLLDKSPVRIRLSSHPEK